MSSRLSAVLRISSWLVVAAIIVVVVLLVRFAVIGPPSVPRSESERAVLAAEQAVEANPEDPAARIKLAAAYLEQGAEGLAIEQAEIATRLDPADPTGYYILGLAQQRRGDTPEAIGNLRRAAETEGQVGQFYQDAYAALARALLDDGNSEEAFAAMDKSIDFGPENAILLFERGAMYEQEEMWVDALYDYSLALTYVSNYQPALDGFERISSEHPEAVDEMYERFDPDGTGQTDPGATTP